MVDLKDIFEKRIYKDHQTRSIDGLFFSVDESLEKTNYSPDYQRNYVWDDEKASYFIESIFLGTEVPPIILYMSTDNDGISKYEVIDGRQRYETIRRFVDNQFKLKKSGLQRLGELEDFVGKSFWDIDAKYQELFKSTYIRTITYSFIGEFTEEEEETVKREVFQRYNSGITPLRTYEIDKALYYYSDLNQALKELLEKEEFNQKITKVFRWEKLNDEQKVMKLRELLVIHRIPIKYYANKKQKVISKYFEYLSSQIDEDDTLELLSSIEKKVEVLCLIERKIVENGITYTRLFAECLFWSMSVMEQNNIEYDLNNRETLSRLVCYLKQHVSDFTTIRSSFYDVLVGRYESISKFFENEYGCSFKLSIENSENFKLNNYLLPQATSLSKVEDASFEVLRIKKSPPVSVRLTELFSKLKSSRFLLRPAYQRADVKNRKKSSSIIESLLLGIMLPPIFVFKRKDGSSEVIDGQQRLLSIISYVEETYQDEDGNLQKPLLYGFKLDLSDNAILKNLKGQPYKKLCKADQNKIRNSSIFIIEITEENNEKFDPVDLFVRLNNKPYPIPADSFEMWNSFAERRSIEFIRQSVADNSRWFYFRKNNARMDNEDLFTTLAYFQYCYDKNGNMKDEIVPAKTIESFVVGNRLACRFRMRNEITKIMYSKQSEELFNALNKLQFSFVSNVYDLLNGSYLSVAQLNKSMDELLKVKNGKRTQMIFYILWILLHDLSCDIVRSNREEIRREVNNICSYIESCKSVDDFKNAVKAFREKYNRVKCTMHSPLGTIAESNISKDLVPTDNSLVLKKKPEYESRFLVNSYNQEDYKSNEEIILNIIRPGINIQYLAAFLRSRLFFHFYKAAGCNMSSDLLAFASVPYISKELQEGFANLLDYIDKSIGSVRTYFERIMDLMFFEQYFADAFSTVQVHITDEVKLFPRLASVKSDEIEATIASVYAERTKPSNIMSLYLLKAIDMQILKVTETHVKP